MQAQNAALQGYPQSLPTSFQEVINITHAICVRYIWFDSLCICQGDEEDWASEDSRMGDMYSGAYLTLAVSISGNSYIVDRETHAVRKCIGWLLKLLIQYNVESFFRTRT
jgi:hypothetical protein